MEGHAEINHFVKKPFGENKSSRNDGPQRNERPQKTVQKIEAEPPHTDKKTFDSKPIFKKRPNFGDKPSPRMSGSNKPKKWHITATCYTKNAAVEKAMHPRKAVKAH